MKTQNKERLKRLFYETMSSVGGFDTLWRETKAKYNGSRQRFKRAEVKEWYESQRSVQEQKQFRRDPKMFTSWRAKAPGKSLAIDLMFWNKEDGPPTGARAKQYSGVLNVIDIYSRKAWSEFIKGDKETNNGRTMLSKGRKGKKSVWDSFASILGRIGKSVKHVNMDEGNEFTNAKFTALLTTEGITPHFSRKQEFAKNPVVERFNRTVRELMRKFRSKGDVKVSVETWQQMIDRYNGKRHRTIKDTPNAVWKDKGKQRQSHTNPTFSFEEGDTVRLLKGKGTLDKGQQYSWSKELYSIYQVDKVKDKKGWKYAKDGTRKRAKAKTGMEPTSRVVRYYLKTADGEFVSAKSKSKDKPEQKAAAWFMGYQLKKVGKVEDAPGYSAAAEVAATKSLTKGNKKDKVRRVLTAEGIEPANVLPVKRSKSKRMKADAKDPLVGKWIRVKWYNALKPLTVAVQSTKTFRKDKTAKKVKHFRGKVLSYDETNKYYLVKYVGDPNEYKTNLKNPTKTTFIPAANWSKA